MRMKMEWMNWFRKSPWATPLAIAGPLGISIGFLGIQQLSGQDDSPSEPPSAGAPSVDFPPQDPNFGAPADLAPPDLPSPIQDPNLTATIATSPTDTVATTWAPPETAPATPRSPINRRVEGQESDDGHVGWAQAPSAPQPALPAQGLPPMAVTRALPPMLTSQATSKDFVQPITSVNKMASFHKTAFK